MSAAVIDISKLKRKHQRFMAEHSRAVDQALDSSLLTGWQWRWISQHGGFKSRTGNLVRKAKVTVIRRGKNRLVRSSDSAAYAHAINSGSGLYGPKRRKYKIQAKNKKSLAFGWGGRLVLVKSVMHPGVRPTRFLYNASDALFRTTKQWLRGAMSTAAKRF